MIKSQLISPVRNLKTFTDIVYLTNQGHMLPEIKKLLKNNKISYITMKTDDFLHLHDQLDLMGTVIVETEGPEIFDRERLAGILNRLESNGVGTILLGEKADLLVKNLSMQSVKSFSLSDTYQPEEMDNLRATITDLLDSRKKNSLITEKPQQIPKKKTTYDSNHLAEQLRVTEALVENLSS